MSTYQVTFATTLNVTVTIDADDEDAAADIAWDRAQEFADSIGTPPTPPGVRAEASFDGIGADDVQEAP